MPCVVQDGFPLVQAGMICDSLQLDFYGCTAMACKLWSRNAQRRSHLPTRSRRSWIERVSSGLGSPSPLNASAHARAQWHALCLGGRL